MPVGRCPVVGDRGRSDGELASGNWVLCRYPFLQMADVVLSWEHPPLVQPAGSLGRQAARAQPEGIDPEAEGRRSGGLEAEVEA